MQAKCRLQGCLGEYEQREIVRATRFQGRLIVIDGVPADVCSFCGDTLFRPDTAETLERFVRKPPAPVDTIPLYRYASLADAPVAPTGADTGSKQVAAGAQRARPHPGTPPTRPQTPLRRARTLSSEERKGLHG